MARRTGFEPEQGAYVDARGSQKVHRDLMLAHLSAAGHVIVAREGKPGASTVDQLQFVRDTLQLALSWSTVN
jgi:hypothetical protein